MWEVTTVARQPCSDGWVRFIPLLLSGAIKMELHSSAAAFCSLLLTGLLRWRSCCNKRSPTSAAAGRTVEMENHRWEAWGLLLESGQPMRFSLLCWDLLPRVLQNSCWTRGKHADRQWPQSKLREHLLKIKPFLIWTHLIWKKFKQQWKKFKFEDMKQEKVLFVRAGCMQHLFVRISC